MNAAAVIEDLLTSFPDATRDGGDGNWHVRRGRRAVAIDDLGAPDDPATGIGVHLLNGEFLTDGSEIWGFDGEPIVESPEGALAVAREFLGQ